DRGTLDLELLLRDAGEGTRRRGDAADRHGDPPRHYAASVAPRNETRAPAVSRRRHPSARHRADERSVPVFLGARPGADHPDREPEDRHGETRAGVRAPAGTVRQGLRAGSGVTATLRRPPSRLRLAAPCGPPPARTSP